MASLLNQTSDSSRHKRRVINFFDSLFSLALNACFAFINVFALSDFDNLNGAVAHAEDINASVAELTGTTIWIGQRFSGGWCNESFWSILAEIAIFQFLENVPSFVGGQHFCMTSRAANCPKVQQIKLWCGEVDIIDFALEGAQGVTGESEEVLADDKAVNVVIVVLLRGCW